MTSENDLPDDEVFSMWDEAEPVAIGTTQVTYDPSPWTFRWNTTPTR